MNNFNKTLTDILKKDLRFLDQDGDLLKSEVIDKAWKVDKPLIELLLSEKQIKDKFFTEIKKHWVFNVAFFVEFVQDKNFLNNSYTKFKNKIGLTVDGKYLNQRGEVALAFPYKDCVLEGGQSNEDTGRDEIFFNEILAQDEIDRLLDPKVFTNWKRFSKNGEEKMKEIKRDENGLIKENLIIKGNNLLALHSLKKQFSGKVKLIYIDPPYNTGNDGFRYNDRFNHSTWLTFMKNRLGVARELLREDGVIFVQCDYNEDSYLKVLMDEIFGIYNFVANIAVKSSTPSGTKTAHKDKKIIKQKDTILFYKKNNIKIIPQYTPRENWDTHYSLFLDKKNGKYNFFKLIDVLKSKGFQYKKLEDINPTNEDIRRFIEENAEKICRLQSHKNKEIDQLSRTKFKDSFYEHIEKNELQGIYYNGQVITPIKRGVKNVYYGKSKKLYWSILLCDFWADIDFQNTQNEGGVSLTSGKKPEALIQRIIEMTTKPRDIILDYHLGSGTTSAVAHKMNRQYIGIEQMSYIEDLAVKRLQNVINEDQSGISKSVEWKGGGDFIYLELKKYNEAFIDRIQSANNTKELEKIWAEMKEKSFLNWNVDFRNADLAFEEWAKLDLKKQQHALVQLLNKNQLYVNMSEVDDKEFRCTDEEKRLSGEFYNLIK